MGQKFSKLHNPKDEECHPLLARTAPQPRSTPRGLESLNVDSTSPPGDLERYMRIAMLRVWKRAPKHIFRRAKEFPTPRLRKDATNRVLVFPGSFNPPHLGHQLLLTHAFFRSKFDNVVAALILPGSTERVKKKHRREQNPLIFSEEERVQLWYNPRLTPWSWVNPYSPDLDDEFQNSLMDAAAEDGFVIEFVGVVGGDHIKEVAARSEIKTDGSRGPCTVFSDAMRLVPYAPGGSPLRLKGFGNWQKTIEPDMRLLSKIQQGTYSSLDVLSLLFPRKGAKIAHKKAPDTQKESLAFAALHLYLYKCGCPWVCVNRNCSDLMIQFVPARKVRDKEAVVADISSTDIRAVIRNVRQSKIIPALKDLALNPGLLSQYVDEKRKKSVVY